MPDKEPLLEELDEGYHALTRSIAGLSDAEMTTAWLGDWAVKDVLAHIAGWHREMAGALGRMARGERPTPEGVDYASPDPWNARFAAERKAMSPAEAVADLDASFAAYRAAAAALPEDRFAPGRTLDRMLHASGIDHYAEHVKEIREWRATLTGRPDGGR